MTLLACFSFASCKKGKNPPTSITIPVDNIYLNVGETETITAIFYPTDASKDVKWTSTNAGIAEVNQGTIHGVSVGVVEITVSSVKAPEVKDSIVVVVSDELQADEYPVVYDTKGGTLATGTISSYFTKDGLPFLPIPKKEGFRFIGWYEGDTLVTEIEVGKTEIVFLEAHYEALLYPTELEIINLKHDFYIGETYTLQVRSNKENDTSFTFTSSNPGVASIDQNGVLTCITKGQTNITITSTVNPNTKLNVTFRVYNIPESLEIRSLHNTIFLNKQLQLKVVGLPSVSLLAVNWESSNPSVASIDAYGVVTGISTGETTITATSVVNPNATAEFTIQILEEPTSIDVSGIPSDEIYISDTLDLSATVYPNSANQEVNWVTSDETIATVDQNGHVEVLDRGIVYITVSSKIKPELFYVIELTCLHPLLEEQESDVKYIITAPGSDAATSICINYHAKNTKTYIEYTVASNPTFEDALTFNPTGVYFEEMDPDLAGTFEERNVFSAEISGLTPNTSYIYRINQGDGTYSEVYSFTTAKGGDEDFSFLWLSDVHYHNLPNESDTPVIGPEISEQTIAAAKEKFPDLAFLLETGDTVDTGGNSAIWDNLYEKRLSHSFLPSIGVPGNHEYYIHGTGQWDNRFFAAYNALPKNGPEGKIGSSCYFVYNDVLFLMIDNVKRSNYDEQIAWIEHTLQTVEAKLVIASMHMPIQSESESNRQDRDETMMTLFEKYGVDLVLTGHYHSDSETRNYYQGALSSDPLLGVNYMIAAGGGVKASGDNDPAAFAKGYIVNVVGTTITVTYINAKGQVLSTRVFESKKYESSVESDNNDISNSLTYTLNKEKNTLTFNWSKLAYGNVEKITFEETLRHSASREVLIITPSYTNTTFTNINDYYDFVYEVVIHFKDGTTSKHTFKISRNTDLNLKTFAVQRTSAILSFDAANQKLQYTIKCYDIYVNGQKIDSVTYLQGMTPVTNYTFTNLITKTNYTVQLVALDYSGNIMFTNEIQFVTK